MNRDGPQHRSIAAKFGCEAETLRLWVRRHERDHGLRPGVTTAERDRIKQLQREVRRPTRPCARPARISPKRNWTFGSSHRSRSPTCTARYTRSNRPARCCRPPCRRHAYAAPTLRTCVREARGTTRHHVPGFAACPTRTSRRTARKVWPVPWPACGGSGHRQPWCGRCGIAAATGRVAWHRDGPRVSVHSQEIRAHRRSPLWAAPEDESFSAASFDALGLSSGDK